MPASPSEVFKGVSLDVARMRAKLPDGTLVDKKRFNVIYGGRTYAMSHDGNHTTTSAWQAFVMNPTFRPPHV